MADDAWTEAEEAGERLREGDHDGAIAEAKRVLAVNPRNEYAWYFLGGAHFEKGEHVQAMKAYVKALEVAPHYTGALVALGHALRLLGRHEEAIKVGREIVGRDAHDPDGLHLLGLAYFARGERARAREYLEKFLATRPEAEVALEVSGMLQVLGGEVVPFPGSEDN
jgi:tetratricopeptide (TPR) repeat protein